MGRALERLSLAAGHSVSFRQDCHRDREDRHRRQRLQSIRTLGEFRWLQTFPAMGDSLFQLHASRVVSILVPRRRKKTASELLAAKSTTCSLQLLTCGHVRPRSYAGGSLDEKWREPAGPCDFDRLL